MTVEIGVGSIILEAHVHLFGRLKGCYSLLNKTSFHPLCLGEVQKALLGTP